MNARFGLALHPIPDAERFDTSLRYTDILFGFVIRELFLRLQNWNQLDDAVRLHLIVGTILVLGSWIGFRRSLYRSGYQVKFFNLPLFRFLIDQVMLILYFRIAVLTDVGGRELPVAGDLARNTAKLVMYVFVLYVVWDLLGIWMARTTTTGADGKEKPLYPVVRDSKMTNEKQRVNLAGFLITVGSMTLLVVLWMFADCFTPNQLFLGTATLLLVYRWAKETRTSWQSLQQA
jgi:hypothetical protein